MDKEYFVNLHYLPIILFVSFPSVCIITYIIAVLLDHVDPVFPYISVAAASLPESCIFAQMINMLVILLSVVIYIRYVQVKEWSRTFSLQESLSTWNRWALVFGLTSAFGLSVVANFPQSSVFVVHFIGAFVCFGSGSAYFWTQALCTFYLHPLGSSLRLVHVRTALCTFHTVSFIVTLITGLLARQAFRGKHPPRWYRDDGGWELHVTSTISEWLCAFAFCAFILTYADEFRNVQVARPKVVNTLNRIRLSNERLNESQDTTRHGRYAARVT